MMYLTSIQASVRKFNVTTIGLVLLKKGQVSGIWLSMQCWKKAVGQITRVPAGHAAVIPAAGQKYTRLLKASREALMLSLLHNVFLSAGIEKMDGRYLLQLVLCQVKVNKGKRDWLSWRPTHLVE
jgi:hypothetical protein